MRYNQFVIFLEDVADIENTLPLLIVKEENDDRVYVATVQLLIEAKSQENADDAVNNILSEYDMKSTLIDWGYLKIGGCRMYPVKKYQCLPGDYEEGDFLHD